jgi:hypothetical protein
LERAILVPFLRKQEHRRCLHYFLDTSVIEIYLYVKH